MSRTIITTEDWEPQDFFEPYTPKWYEARAQHLRDTEKFEPLVASGDEFLDAYSSHDMMNLPPANWLIQGLIEEQGLSVVYGKPKSGKTIWLTNMLWAWVMGEDWWFDESFTFDNPEAKSERRVLYLMLEGAASYADRLTAWAGSNGMDPYDQRLANFVVVPHGVALNREGTVRRNKDGVGVMELGPTERLSNLIKLLEPQILVVDTLSRAIPGGDENSQTDMSQLVGVLDSLRDRHGVATIVVHHTARGDDSHPRGSTVLEGAVSSGVRIGEGKDGKRWVQVADQRNMEGNQDKIPMQFMGRGKAFYVAKGEGQRQATEYALGLPIQALADAEGISYAGMKRRIERAGYTTVDKAVGPKRTAEEVEDN